MFNLNRITLIGNTGTNAKTNPNGPTTLSLAKQCQLDRQHHRRALHPHRMALVSRLERLGQVGCYFAERNPLFVGGELVYEQYPRKVHATLGKKTVEVEVPTKVAKIRVQRLIRLESAINPEAEDLTGEAQ